MKCTSKLLAVFARLASAAIGCAAALAVSAQEVPIRVSIGSAMPLPYSLFYFTADGLRLNVNEISATSVSVTVSGSRVVATILVVTDIARSLRGNSIVRGVALPPGTYTSGARRVHPRTAQRPGELYGGISDRRIGACV